MPKPAQPATIESLLAKGDGALVKRNGVWTYPSAPNDPSGTNLKLPIEFLSDAVVQEAVTKGDLVAKAVDASGQPTTVVQKAGDGEEPVRIVDMARAGSSELGTEIPLNSRPTHDAGRRLEPQTPVQDALDVKAPKPTNLAPSSALPVPQVPAPEPAK